MWGEYTYLLLVVQALVVVLKDGHAFRLAAVVLGVCVGDVAREDFLPEGEAARGACLCSLVKASQGVVLRVVCNEEWLRSGSGGDYGRRAVEVVV